MIEQELARVEHGPKDVFQPLLRNRLASRDRQQFFLLLGGGRSGEGADVDRFQHLLRRAACLEHLRLTAPPSRTLVSTVSPLSKCSDCDSVGSVFTSQTPTVARFERPKVVRK